MIDVSNLETYANKISSLFQSNQLASLAKVLSEIRDSIEIVHTHEYSNFLKALFVPILDVVKNTECQFETNEVQRVRNLSMEIICRLPCNESIKSYAKELMDVSMKVLQEDNEENALCAIKIVTELFKTFRHVFENHVKPFFNFVIKLYTNFPSIVKEDLSVQPGDNQVAADDKDTEKDESEDTSKQQITVKPIVSSSLSCKVLTECPMVLIFLFQVFAQSYAYVKEMLQPLSQKLIESFDVPLAQPQTSSPKLRQRYVDLITAQVKAASFLAFAIRMFKDILKNQRESLPKILAELLLRCPNESIASRKDLLVLMRHMIDSHNADLKEFFLPFIDKLLDDSALLGKSRTSYETLRPLAYSTLADLIHHVRAKLNLDQISKIVNFYTRIMYDPTLGLSIQTMSAKLLVHLVESIFKQQHKEQGRNVLVAIMSAFVTKIKALGRFIEQIRNEPPTNEPVTDNEKIDSLKVLPFGPYKRTETTQENTQNCRLMLKTLILGLKNIIIVLLNIDNQQNSTLTSASVKTMHSAEETKLFISLFKHGMLCFNIYNSEQFPPTDEKENLDSFSSLFTLLAEGTFQEIFRQQMPYLYMKILENQKYLTIPTHFLASQQVSNHFSDIMLHFLIERMNKMAGNTNESNVLLQLFKLVLGSVVTFPNNETVLKPHLGAIINNCLTFAAQTKESTNYFMTIRALFRSIVSGKFDQLIKEFNVYLSFILEKLTEMLKGSFKSPIRDLCIELCLTVPAKLHILCPYLPILIRPVLLALRGSNDLVTFGLRNLDMWVNSLKIESLEPVLKPVMPELLHALFSHLKPPPYPYGLLAMKILAKLGSLNRSYLVQPYSMDINEIGEDGLKIMMHFTPASFTEQLSIVNYSQDFSMDTFVSLSRRVLYSNGSKETREQAFNFLKTCLLCMIDLSGSTVQDFKMPSKVDGFRTSKTGLTIYASNKFFDPYNVEQRDLLPKTQTKMAAENALFKKLISNVIIAMADPVVADLATPFVKGLCRHFALLSISKCNQLPDPLHDLNPDIFLDALVDVFCHENSDVEKSAAEQALEEFVTVMNIMCNYDKEQVVRFSAWDKLALRLCHCCYQREWFKKFGGCKGIVCLCKNLSPVWLKRHEIDFVKALLFIIKDSPAQMTMFTIDEASRALDYVIRTCRTDDVLSVNEDPTNSTESKKMHDLLLVLVSELSSSHSSVRKSVQNLIKLVSELRGKPITVLLDTFRTSLHNSIRVDRFDSLVVQLKTGFCEAVTFFLSLDPPLLTLTPQIIQIIEKALALCNQNAKEHLTSKSQTALKMACLRLLREALNCSDLKASQHNKLRNQMISVFFNYLGFQNKEIVSIAKSALATLIAQQRLPKDLLQTSLRPILSNLGNYMKLTFPVLETLSHLLELCTSYFSPKLGEQLLEHLKKWTDPQKITHLQKYDAPLVAANILNLFSLLPPDAKKFLQQLVEITVQLGTAWKDTCSEMSSPFREPLAKFLNLYPKYSINYFLGSVDKSGCIFDESNDNQFFKLFMSMLKSQWCPKLREAISSNPASFISCTFDAAKKVDRAHRVAYTVKNLAIVKAILQFVPDWLIQNESMILKELLILWDEYIGYVSSGSSQTQTGLAQQQTKYILECFIFSYNAQQDIDILFKMLYALAEKSSLELGFLREFYEQDVPKFSTAFKAKILERFLEMFADPVNNAIKIEALQHLVIPILLHCFEKREDDQLLSKEIVANIVNTLFSSQQGERMDESLRVELLQLATLLIRNASQKLLEYRKQIIKFAYIHMKSEDITSKQCAYVLASYFIKSYESPLKIILQVYVNLLKSHQPEGKALIKQALDILATVLPSQNTTNQKQKQPKWIVWTKRILVEEGHSLPQLIHIWQFFVRHPLLFYPYRDTFISKIVNSLARIGISPNQPLENRKLAVDLTELVINWEIKRIEEGATEFSTDADNDAIISDAPDNEKKRKAPDSSIEQPSAKRLKTDAGAIHVDANAEAKPRQQENKQKTAEVTVNFLLRCAGAVFTITKVESGSNQQQQLASQCVEVLKKAIKLWPFVKVNFSLIEKIITAENADAQAVCVGVEIMKVVVENNIESTILSNLPSLINIVKKLITMHQAKPTKLFAEFMTLLLNTYPVSSASDAIHDFYSQIWEALEQGVSSLDTNQQQQTPVSSQPSQGSINSSRLQCYGYITTLKLLSDHMPEKVQSLSPIVMKIFNKLLLEHITATHEKMHEAQEQHSQAQTQQANQASTQPQAAPKLQINNMSEMNFTQVESIELCIDLLSTSIAEQTKKTYWTTIIAILDKANEINDKLMLKVLSEIHSWFTGSSARRAEVATKAKLSFLAKLPQLEQCAHENVKEAYYNMLIELYNDEKLMQSDAILAARVESVFMTGLKAENPNTRKRFLDVLNQKLSKTVFDRLNYILHSQHWESLGDSFWIRHALDLLLDVLDTKTPVAVSTHTSRLYPLTGKEKEQKSSSMPDSPRKHAEKSEESNAETVQENQDLGDSSTGTEDSKMDVENDSTDPQANVISIEFSDEAKQLLSNHQIFMNKCSDYLLCDIVEPLRRLARESIRLSYDLWIVIFPLAWKVLKHAERDHLQRQLEHLLARDYHAKQYIKYPNVIQALLEGVSRCEPKISLNPEMLKFVGKSFNAWSIVLPMLENEVQSMISSNMYDEKTDRVCSSLCELYKVLAEDDMLVGIWRNHDISEVTKNIFALEQFGLWTETQESLKDVMDSYSKGTLDRKNVTHSEISIWEDHWITCAKKLQQFDELAKYAKSVHSAGLMLECHWKSGDWKSIRDVFTRHPVAENQLLRIYQISAAIMDQQDKNASEYYQQATAVALQRWCALPSFFCNTHVTLLHNFQQLIELSDSTSILSEAKKPQDSSKGPIAPNELKAILGQWRDRVPSDWDDISYWNDLLTWRTHFLVAMSKQFDASLEQHKTACQNEAIWTTTKLASILRKNKLNDAAFRLLSDSTKITSSQTIAENEALFYRMYQMVKCHIADGKYNEASELINQEQSVAKLKTYSKADILRLKGDVLIKLDKKEEAHRTYSQALGQYQDPRVNMSSGPGPLQSIGKVFLRWGLLTDDMLTEKMQQSLENSESPDLSLAESAIVSYLQALRYHPNHKARQMIPRILWLLSFDSDQNLLQNAMDKSLADISPFVWIPWINNLFSMIFRKEAKIIKTIIYQLGRAYPQAIYYNLRSFYFDIREMVKDVQQKPVKTTQKGEQPVNASSAKPPVAQAPANQSKQSIIPIAAKKDTTPSKSQIQVSIKSKQQQEDPSGSKQAKPSTLSVNHPLQKTKKHSEELMTHVLQSYQPMVHEIETLLKELNNKLKPELEEELQRALDLLLRKCYQRNVHTSEPVPQELAEYAKKIHNSIFPKEDNAQVRSNFFKETKKNMKRDLIPSEYIDLEENEEPPANASGPRTIMAMIEAIRKWQKTLQERINLLPNVLPLEHMSRYLSDCNAGEVEIPGQYLSLEREPYVDQHERVMCFLPDVDVIKRNKVNCRRVTIRSHNGKLYKFLIQSLPPMEETNYGKTEERTWALVHHVNRILLEDKPSRRKNLKIHAPIVVALSQKMRLVHERASFFALEDVYHEFCLERKMNADAPLLHYWKEMLTCNVHNPDLETRIHAFQEVAATIPSDILSKYLKKHFMTWSDMYQLRKKLTPQLALYGIMNYLLNIPDRALHKILISKNSGEVYQFDMRPSFDKLTGKFKVKEDKFAVPFRLTPNLQNLLTPFATQGSMLNTASVAAYALVKSKEKLENIVRLYIRDELQAWQASTLLKADVEIEAEDWYNAVDPSASEKIEYNTAEIMNRLTAVLPIYSTTDTMQIEGEQGAAAHTYEAPDYTVIAKLIESAQDQSKLCLMDPTWHPWF